MNPPIPPAQDAKQAPACSADVLETFRARCFWWVRPDVALWSLPLDTLRRGLSTYGGRPGLQYAAQL